MVPLREDLLQGFRPEGYLPDLADILAGREMLTPRQLRDRLIEAKIHYLQAKGPHQYDRIVRETKDFFYNRTISQSEVGRIIENRSEPQFFDLMKCGDWLGWWISYFDRYDFATCKTLPIIVPFEQVAETLHRLGGSSGLLFGGSMEGHQGHRWAVRWMTGAFGDIYYSGGYAFFRECPGIDCPVLCLDIDEYSVKVKDKIPFIPLEMRLMMWYYYKLSNGKCLGMVTTAPPWKEGESVNDRYDRLFIESGVKHPFFTPRHDFERQKSSRGELVDASRIPLVSTERTTNRVYRMLPRVN